MNIIKQKEIKQKHFIIWSKSNQSFILLIYNAFIFLEMESHVFFSKLSEKLQ